MAQSTDPSYSKFRHHVSFDNFGGGESTERNMISFTLNVSHRGYQRKRRSRTFMIGIGENDYSDIALRWMLEEMVDDGDHIICLRVVDKDSKIVNDKNMERRDYQKIATELMARIQSRSDENKALNITLEFAIGKVSTTFERMIAMYEPSMLIVGTRGRSLGGFQGLVGNRNSFSKWCLQHSPIPVVVVRPTEKRIKKKLKRDADPTRQDYARILRESGIDEHEIESGDSNSGFEVPNDLDMEALAVATALNLPARFDPMHTHAVEGPSGLHPHDLTHDNVHAATTSMSSNFRDLPLIDASKPIQIPPLDSPELSGDEAGDSDEVDGEFEALPGHLLLANDPDYVKKEKLQRMEQGEAGALLLARKSSVSSTGSSRSGGMGGLDFVPAEPLEKVDEVRDLGETAHSVKDQP